MSREYNVHHIIPRSRGGKNHPCNLSTMRVTQHRALHTLFDTQVTREKIQTILELDFTVLTDEVKSDIIHLLNNDDRDYWYRKEAFRHK